MTRPDKAIEVQICSPPDRNKLVASIMVEHVEIAELNQEGAELHLEIYPRPDGKPWSISYKSFIESLQLAKTRLLG